jgi:hypothetical protein
MTSTINRTLTVLLALGAFSTAAPAHQIWIEQPPGEDAVIRFGEFGDNLREVSPGLLDKFGKPSARLVSAQGERAAPGRKTAAGFALPFTAGPGETIVAEDASYPLYIYKQGDQEISNWYFPAARLVSGFAAQAPRLTLDLVPTGKPGEFRLFYQATALAKAKVTLVTPSGWSKEAHSDAQGTVEFEMPWQGVYVAEVSHPVRTPGERIGGNGPEKYDVVNYVTTLTFAKPDGLAPIPAATPAAPGK